MPAFNREIIESVVAACQVGQPEATEALRRTFDASVELTVGEAGEFRVDQLPPECQGSGLILVLRVGAEAALVVLPDTTRAVPEWCARPDETDRKKLATLAVDLGALLLPETFPATDGQAGYVRDLAAALRRSGISAEAARVPITVQNGPDAGVMSLIWPASLPAAALQESSEPAFDASSFESSVLQEVESRADAPTADASSWDSGAPIGTGAGATPGSASAAARRPKIQCEEVEDGLPQLPAYSRSLLKIQVPVMVTLAEAKQPIRNVLDMGPGSIIHFNKPCEDTLSLEIAGRKIALGEAVKVGDKFGIWLTSMILPEERFWVINSRTETERAK